VSVTYLVFCFGKSYRQQSPVQIIIDQKEPDNVEYFQLFGKHHNK